MTLSRPMLGISLATLLLAATFACSSGTTTTGGAGGSSGTSGSSGAGTVPCRQKADADGDDDCVSKIGMPRKLDCDVESEKQAAIAAGCVSESAGDLDVCCPTSVSGRPERRLAGCSEPVDSLTDSDCVGTPEARKLDCDTAAQQSAAIALGCRAEDESDATDLGICCPTNFRQE